MVSFHQAFVHYLVAHYKDLQVNAIIQSISSDNFVSDKPHRRKHLPSHFEDERNEKYKIGPKPHHTSTFYLEDGNIIKLFKKEASCWINMEKFTLDSIFAAYDLNEAIYRLKTHMLYGWNFSPAFLYLDTREKVEAAKKDLNLGPAKFEKVIVYRNQDHSSCIDLFDMALNNGLVLAFNGNKWSLFVCKLPTDEFLSVSNLKFNGDKHYTTPITHPVERFGYHGKDGENIKIP